METYRVLWLSVGVSLGLIGAAAAVANSPAAVASLFIVLGGVGSLLTLCLVNAYWVVLGPQKALPDRRLGRADSRNRLAAGAPRRLPHSNSHGR
jgi:hypothetical protein